MYPAGRNAVTKATLTVSNTAVGFADATPAMDSDGKVDGKHVSGIIVTIEDDSIRYWLDGSVPTSTDGHLQSKEQPIIFIDWDYSATLKNMKFIRVTTDAKLKISFFG